MGLDIRWPIGLMFSLIGVILVIFGIASAGSDMYKASLGLNVNLYWGLLLLVFGGWMLFHGVARQQAGSVRAEKKDKP